MKRFIEGEERGQLSLLPTSLDDYVEEDHSIRVIDDAFIDELDLKHSGGSHVFSLLRRGGQAIIRQHF